MKYIIVLLITLLTVNYSANAQNKLKPAKTESKREEQIKQFWFVMLKKGDNRTQDSATAVKIQEGHMANIKRLYDEGKLKVAGPFGDDGDWRGIFIFDVATKEEVQQLLGTDPAIAAGRLAYEIHPWWTSPDGSFTPGLPNKDK
jgi:uncharacterized protein